MTNRSGDAGSWETPTAGGPARGGAGGWGKRLLFGLGALAFALGLAAVVVEVGLWIFAPIPFHEWLIWEPEGHIRARPVPGQQVHNASGFQIAINRYGFRGPDHAYRKEPGVLRIAVFGGSSTFCFNASSEEVTWVRAVELALHEALEMPVEVMNLGLPGYDAFNSKINYQCFGRAFAPDVALIYHTWNDLKSFRAVPSVPYRATKGVPNEAWWKWVARRFQLGRRGRHVLWTLRQRQMENLYIAGDVPHAWEDPIEPEAFAWARRNFADFALLAASDGVLPVLLSQAMLIAPEGVAEESTRFELQKAPLTTGMSLPVLVSTVQRMSAIIGEVAAKRGEPYIDVYSAVPHDLEHFRDHVHLTDKGNAVVGNIVAEGLLADARFRAVVARVQAEVARTDAP